LLEQVKGISEQKAAKILGEGVFLSFSLTENINVDTARYL
jgi:hypothetical protein